MARAGWSKLIPSDDCFRGSAAFRIDAYSEYMPPPRVGWKPYSPLPVYSELFSPDDPFGWKVHEFDEALELHILQWEGKAPVTVAEFMNGLRGRGKALPLEIDSGFNET